MGYQAKIQITEDLIWGLFPSVNPKRGRENKAKNIKGFVYTYNKYGNYFGIDTALELNHFISQIITESDSFNAYEEYASGDAYDTRVDLGNTPQKDGDGKKYKGRGPLQITGAKNYETAGKEIYNLPFLTPQEKELFANNGIKNNPTLLADPVWGTLSALNYWIGKDLNSLCVPDNQKVTIKRYDGKKWYNYTCSPNEAITRKINGGLNGYDDRVKNYEKLKTKIK